MRVVFEFGDWVVMKIALCLDSRNTRQATLIAHNRDSIYRETITLPFDVSERARHFSIDWHPNQIVRLVHLASAGLPLDTPFLDTLPAEFLPKKFRDF